MSAIKVESIQNLPNPYVPRWTGVGQWCSKLGMINKDWKPGCSLYNDGKHLYCIEKQPPYSRFNHPTLWKLVAYNKFSIWSRVRSGLVSHPLSIFSDFQHHGHTSVGIVALSMSIKGCNGLINSTHALSPRCLMHVVYKSGHPVIGFEARYLPPSVFGNEFCPV